MQIGDKAGSAQASGIEGLCAAWGAELDDRAAPGDRPDIGEYFASTGDVDPRLSTVRCTAVGVTTGATVAEILQPCAGAVERTRAATRRGRRGEVSGNRVG